MALLDACFVIECLVWGKCRSDDAACNRLTRRELGFPYAQTHLGASSFLSVLTLLSINVAAVIGCVAMGSLTNRLDVVNCILVSHKRLISGFPWKGKAGAGYGSGHGPLIVFTGVTALLGGASVVWKQFGWLN